MMSEQVTFEVQERSKRATTRGDVFFIVDGKGAKYESWDASTFQGVDVGDMVRVEFERKVTSKEIDGQTRTFTNLQAKWTEKLGEGTPARESGAAPSEPNSSRDEMIMRQTAGKCAAELLSGEGSTVKWTYVLYLMEQFYAYFKDGESGTRPPLSAPYGIAVAQAAQEQAARPDDEIPF